ncbi:hypothetical protein AB8B12_15940, partial [Streptomyces sp. PGLac3x]
MRDETVGAARQQATQQGEASVRDTTRPTGPRGGPARAPVEADGGPAVLPGGPERRPGTPAWPADSPARPGTPGRPAA